MASQFILHGPHDLHDLIGRILISQRCWWSRAVQADLEDDRLHLRGRVPTYYQKQLAQEAFRHIEGIGRIVNELQVSR